MTETEQQQGEKQGDASIVVAAYVKAYAVAQQGDRPDGANIGRLGRLAKTLLEEGANWVILEQCAQEVGAFDRHPEHLREAYERKVKELEVAKVNADRDTIVIANWEKTNGRITGWRELRGSHSVDYVPAPLGTDRNPHAPPIRQGDRTLARLIRAQSDVDNTYDQESSNIVDISDYV